MMNNSYYCAKASFLSYSERANLSHELSGGLPGWQLSELCTPLNNLGYYAIAIYNETSKTCIISHRGTCVFKNHIENAQIALGFIPEITKLAENFSQMVIGSFASSGYEIIQTGHSLGGAVAELCAHRFHSKCICFDSPGVMNLLSQEDRESTEAEVITYLSSPHIINTCGEHYGQIIRLYPSHISDSQNIFLAVGMEFIAGKYFSCVNPIGMAFVIFATVIAKYGWDYQTVQQHAMKNILGTFSVEIKQPFLQRRVVRWPTLSEYLLACEKHFTTSVSYTIVEQATLDSITSNRRIEEFNDVCLADCYCKDIFIQPELSSTSFITDQEKRCLHDFFVTGKTHFDEFYSNPYLKLTFVNSICYLLQNDPQNRFSSAYISSLRLILSDVAPDKDTLFQKFTSGVLSLLFPSVYRQRRNIEAMNAAVSYATTEVRAPTSSHFFQQSSLPTIDIRVLMGHDSK
ncbi:MAG: hypothetical protein LRY67_05745 [Gammaproteobacteria bacterium]|nr:hypothetical protein [Gammaproteobacteria bacterium]MCD8542188.1 hypothetical protein [Gammaproteobacteria bacterium]